MEASPVEVDGSLHRTRCGDFRRGGVSFWPPWSIAEASVEVRFAF